MEDQDVIVPPISLSSEWQVIGPFQIGTREATWGADPLERIGGFRSLGYDQNTTFPSSLAPEAKVGWTIHKSASCTASESGVEAEVIFGFPNIDWDAQQRIYGWSSLQWQAWARSSIYVHANTTQTVVIYLDGILEFYVDSEHYFGGDYYAFRKAPVVLRLAPGHHSLDMRLVRDVRSMGGDRHAISVPISLRLSTQPLFYDEKQTIVPDCYEGKLYSHYASIAVRNDAQIPLVVNLRDGEGLGFFPMSEEPALIAAGQTRTLEFHLASDFRVEDGVNITLEIYHLEKKRGRQVLVKELHIPRIPIRQRSAGEAFCFTYPHTFETVGYVMVKPPARKFWEQAKSFPVILDLHGAGVEASDPAHTHSLDGAGELPAWILFPAGGTPWSGDDWHQVGLVHTRHSLYFLEYTMNGAARQQPPWNGPHVDIKRTILIGHSNGGQGVWYMLTHHPEEYIAAAESSGYSSIQNYVPYQYWHNMDPRIKAVLDGVLLTYRHELLLDNAKGIPLLLQHGSADSNVPPYHSRLMYQSAAEAGLNADYHEISGAEHWFEGIMTTPAMRDFFEDHLSRSTRPDLRKLPLTVVSARPGDFTIHAGIEILMLKVPGQLGTIKVTQDPHQSLCRIETRNVQQFRIYGWDAGFTDWRIDGQAVFMTPRASFEVLGETWQAARFPLDPYNFAPGGLDAVLRAHEGIDIGVTSRDAAASRIALQVCRNLHQYFSIPTTIHDGTLGKEEGVMIHVGASHLLNPRYRGTEELVTPSSDGHSFCISTGSTGGAKCYNDSNGPIGAIWLVQNRDFDRLANELHIWGSDAAGLALAARLLPMLPGVGQPDFIVVDRQILAKGAAGCLAMGLYNTTAEGSWVVSSNAYYS